MRCCFTTNMESDFEEEVVDHVEREQRAQCHSKVPLETDAGLPLG